MVELDPQAVDALKELREAARDAWASSMLIRSTQGRSITRSDLALQRLHAALAKADAVEFKPRPVVAKRAPRK